MLDFLERAIMYEVYQLATKEEFSETQNLEVSPWIREALKELQKTIREYDSGSFDLRVKLWPKVKAAILELNDFLLGEVGADFQERERLRKESDNSERIFGAKLLSADLGEGDLSQLARAFVARNRDGIAFEEYKQKYEDRVYEKVEKLYARTKDRKS